MSGGEQLVGIRMEPIFPRLTRLRMCNMVAI
jgi:hypothetical protein